jgi:iron complex transport system substrate-binding protein
VHRVLRAGAAWAIALACAWAGGIAPRAWASASVHPLVVRDDVGRTVTLHKAAWRVVSLVPSDTQIALALGLRSRLVGVDADSFTYLPQPYRSQVKGLPSIGNTYPSPSVERILQVRPNLVLAYPGMNLAVNKLTRLGVPVLVLNPASLSGIEHDIQLVGEATGRTSAAQQVVHQLSQAVSAIRAKVQAQRVHPRVFIEISPQPIYAAGPGSYMDSLLHLLGAINVMDGRAHVPYPVVSSEEVIAADPTVIVLADEPQVTPAQVRQRPGWDRIWAVAHGRVYANVDPDALNQPGPAIVQALEQLARDLYPSAFGGDRGSK